MFSAIPGKPSLDTEIKAFVTVEIVSFRKTLVKSLIIEINRVISLDYIERLITKEIVGNNEV
jgi:hypothetical protein